MTGVTALLSVAQGFEVAAMALRRTEVMFLLGQIRPPHGRQARRRQPHLRELGCHALATLRVLGQIDKDNG
jgi:hypothetical protein